MFKCEIQNTTETYAFLHFCSRSIEAYSRDVRSMKKPKKMSLVDGYRYKAGAVGSLHRDNVKKMFEEDFSDVVPKRQLNETVAIGIMPKSRFEQVEDIMALLFLHLRCI